MTLNLSLSSIVRTGQKVVSVIQYVVFDKMVLD